MIANASPGLRRVGLQVREHTTRVWQAARNLRHPRVRVLAAMAALVGSPVALGHEVRPAYLQIAATAPGEYQVLWKQPVAAGRILPITPVFPTQCSASAPRLDPGSRDALVRRFALTCPDGLRGSTVGVDGLAGTITDVMLHATLADGTTVSKLLKPSAPDTTIGAEGAQGLSYLVLGIEHLLFGYDHILFVVSLMFFTAPVSLANGRLRHHPGALVKTVTAFTAAHSVTLSCAALGIARLPQAPVEAVIALSIMFLAVEKLRGTTDSITANHTWIVAFAFGLLHGFGFAGALADIGLPSEADALLALLLFNLGVEIGQLAVVAVGILVIVGVVAWRKQVPRRLIEAPLYVTGGLAAYWLVARVYAMAN